MLTPSAVGAYRMRGSMTVSLQSVNPFYDA
jgi:hypothetical protein